jgi:glutathione S-transferase
MTPGSCSTGIHILLEELDLLFECYPVNLLAGDQYKPEYLDINPKGTIPTLVYDDIVLTDFQAIAWWLARKYPDTMLIPGNLYEEVRLLDIMNYVIGTIHMQGFARIFTTDKYTPDEKDHEWVKQQGRDIINKGFSYIEKMLSDSGLVLGTFSIADAALFYVEFWAIKTGIELPEKCQHHYQQMLKRPAVRQVLAEEGYSII